MTRRLELFNRIHGHYKTTQEIQLLNTYRGMPISYPGKMLDLNEQNLTIKVHKHQAVCLELHRQTYIRLTHPPLIAAAVCGGEISRQVFVLSDLAFADPAIGNRKVIRVNPKSPLPVVLTNPRTQRKIASELIDISTAGLGVYGLSVSLADIRDFAKETAISARLILPEHQAAEKDTREIEIKGRVINLLPNQNQRRFRLGIQIDPNPQNQAVIAAYVSQRQVEIINEIRRLYNTLVQLS